jgi:hypothetical protein
MTVDEIDHDLEQLADQARASGNEGEGPGLIMLSADTWCRPGFVLGHEHTLALRGIRYRGVRVHISSKYEDRVLTRKEALAACDPGEFEPFTEKPPTH